MYRINFSETTSQLFIAVSRFRTGLELEGTKDGVNTTFLVPAGDKFVHDLPFLTAQIFWNGQRLNLFDDYAVGESEGPNSGYDTVYLTIAPRGTDKLIADYVTQITFEL